MGPAWSESIVAAGAVAVCGSLLGCELLAGIDDRNVRVAPDVGGAGGAGGGGGSSTSSTASSTTGAGGVATECTPDECSLPAPVCSGGSCVQVARIASGLGWWHTCAVLANGAARCWGKNDRGQIGVDPMGDPGEVVLTPVEVVASGVVDLSLGKEHSCALLEAGNISCWGGNAAGQLGSGEVGGDQWAPQEVAGIATATRVSAGFNHTCAVLRDGSVQCWGLNDWGQLGTGDQDPRSTPAPVVGLSGAVDVSTGERHSCAILAGGTVRCWGHQGSGQLGDGIDTETAQTTPVVVQTDALDPLTGAVQIELGNFHSCARMSDASVWCWGGNGFGALGDGTTVDRPRAQPVASLAGAVDLSAGYRQTCALIGSTAWCLGGGLNGDLGDGNSGDFHMVTSATKVLGADDVIELSTLFHHSCIVRRGGGLSCWGLNDHGQTGDGTQVSPRTSPVDVLWW